MPPSRIRPAPFKFFSRRKPLEPKSAPGPRRAPLDGGTPPQSGAGFAHQPAQSVRITGCPQGLIPGLRNPASVSPEPKCAYILEEHGWNFRTRPSANQSWHVLSFINATPEDESQRPARPRCIWPWVYHKPSPCLRWTAGPVSGPPLCFFLFLFKLVPPQKKTFHHGCKMRARRPRSPGKVAGPSPFFRAPAVNWPRESRAVLRPCPTQVLEWARQRHAIRGLTNEPRGNQIRHARGRRSSGRCGRPVLSGGIDDGPRCDEKFHHKANPAAAGAYASQVPPWPPPTSAPSGSLFAVSWPLASAPAIRAKRRARTSREAARRGLSGIELRGRLSGRNPLIRIGPAGESISSTMRSICREKTRRGERERCCVQSSWIGLPFCSSQPPRLVGRFGASAAAYSGRAPLRSRASNGRPLGKKACKPAPPMAAARRHGASGISSRPRSRACPTKRRSAIHAGRAKGRLNPPSRARSEQRGVDLHLRWMLVFCEGRWYNSIEFNGNPPRRQPAPSESMKHRKSRQGCSTRNEPTGCPAFPGRPMINSSAKSGVGGARANALFLSLSFSFPRLTREPRAFAPCGLSVKRPAYPTAPAPVSTSAARTAPKHFDPSLSFQVA